MNRILANTLLDRGIVIPGTLIYGKTQVAGLGQMLQLTHMELMIESFDNEYFICRDRLGAKYFMHVDNVIEIDGMDPARLANVYNIKADGTDKTVGKKRGRKPKTAHINSLPAQGELNGLSQ